MVVMAPSDENELARMMATAIQHDGPISFRYPRGAGECIKIEDDPRPIPIGKARLINPGSDLLILAIGKSVNHARIAVDQLREEGYDPALIDARFVKPLDRELILEQVSKINKIITVEEHVLDGGFGSAVMELLMDSGTTPFQLKRIGIQDVFVEHGPQKILREEYKIDHHQIVTVAKQLYQNGCA